MTELDRSFDENVYDLNAILHPGSVFDHPRDVLADTTLSRAEKRAILASWASDAAAVTSCPSLRAIPGIKRTVSIDERMHGQWGEVDIPAEIDRAHIAGRLIGPIARSGGYGRRIRAPSPSSDLEVAYLHASRDLAP